MGSDGALTELDANAEHPEKRQRVVRTSTNAKRAVSARKGKKGK
jgi:hypothetical protein